MKTFKNKKNTSNTLHTIKDINKRGKQGFELIQQYEKEGKQIDPELESELKLFFKEAQNVNKQGLEQLQKLAIYLQPKVKKKLPWLRENQYTPLDRLVESILIATDNIQ